MSQNRRTRKRKGKLLPLQKTNAKIQDELENTKLQAIKVSTQFESLRQLCFLQEQKLKKSVASNKQVYPPVEHIPNLRQIDRALLTKLKQDSFLGKGAFGSVELCRFHGYCVAVKEFSEHTKLQNVIEEATIMSKLSHYNLPYLFGICTCDLPYSLVSRFCGINGSSLTVQDAMGRKECSCFPWFSIMLESADALDYLHNVGYLHNDIKGDNLLLTNDTSLPEEHDNVHAVLNDFGKSTELTKGKIYNLTVTQKQKYYKCHSHIAPEVIEGSASQSTRSDIFSLGLIFYFVAKTFGNNRLKEIAKSCTRSNPALRCSLVNLKCKLKAEQNLTE